MSRLREEPVRHTVPAGPSPGSTTATLATASSNKETRESTPAASDPVTTTSSLPSSSRTSDSAASPSSINRSTGDAPADRNRSAGAPATIWRASALEPPKLRSDPNARLVFEPFREFYQRVRQAGSRNTRTSYRRPSASLPHGPGTTAPYHQVHSAQSAARNRLPCSLITPDRDRSRAHLLQQAGLHSARASCTFLQP